MEESRNIGSVISELLIPFLLVKGVKEINGKDIIVGMDSDDEISSVEWPTSANHSLTDYDVIFANTAKGRRFAISAKYENGNHPSLIGKLANYSGKFTDFKTTEFRGMLEIAREFRKKLNAKHNYVTRSLWQIAKFLNADFECPEEITYDAISEGAVRKLPDEMVDQIHEDYSDGKLDLRAFQEKIKTLPASLTLLFEARISTLLNSRKDILEDIYNMIFNYFDGAEFQQIELSKNLDLKYITRKRVERNEIEKVIEIENTGSINQTDPKKTLNQSHPLGIVLR